VDDEVDALVVGGGPAGLAAATWLGRHRRRTLIVDSGRYRNAAVTHAHGYLGSDPVPPMELLERARTDLRQYPEVALRAGEVTAIEPVAGDEEVDDDHFVVRGDDLRVRARRVVLATGVRDELPDLDGFSEHYGKDVFHCPACEGYDATGREVAVIGWGRHVPPFAVQLLDTAAVVRIVTGSDSAEITPQQRRRLDDHDVEVIDGETAAFVGAPGELEGIRLADGTRVPASMVFFSIEHHPVVDLARTVGCALTPEGLIETDPDGATCVPGIYAAGDVTPGMQLVSVAAAQGAVAGIACAMSLRGERTSPRSPDPAPDPAEVAAT
jgi:thioredoxin reductase